MKVFNIVVEKENNDIIKVVLADSCKQNVIKQISINMPNSEIIKIKDITKDTFASGNNNEVNKFIGELEKTSYNKVEKELLLGLFREFLDK